MDTFEFNGLPYGLFDHPYNTTRVNERAVEVPLAAAWLHAVAGLVLPPSSPAPVMVEIGNVMAHYGHRPSSWSCLDLYEEGPEVINEDVRTWTPPGTLRAVLAVSTFEHVGLEDGTDPHGAAPALERVASLLAVGGAMLVTLPMGQNPALDAVLLAGGTSAESAVTLVRGELDSWHQTDEPEWRPYIGHGRGAQSVWVGQFGQALI